MSKKFSRLVSFFAIGALLAPLMAFAQNPTVVEPETFSSAPVGNDTEIFPFQQRAFQRLVLSEAAARKRMYKRLQIEGRITKAVADELIAEADANGRAALEVRDTTRSFAPVVIGGLVCGGREIEWAGGQKQKAALGAAAEETKEVAETVTKAGENVQKATRVARAGKAVAQTKGLFGALASFASKHPIGFHGIVCGLVVAHATEGLPSFGLAGAFILGPNVRMAARDSGNFTVSGQGNQKYRGYGFVAPIRILERVPAVRIGDLQGEYFGTSLEFVDIESNSGKSSLTHLVNGYLKWSLDYKDARSLMPDTFMYLYTKGSGVEKSNWSLDVRAFTLLTMGYDFNYFGPTPADGMSYPKFPFPDQYLPARVQTRHGIEARKHELLKNVTPETMERIRELNESADRTEIWEEFQRTQKKLSDSVAK